MCKAIRKEKTLEGAYCIMLTAKSGQAETVAALEAGVDEFLNKPVNDDELKARVRAGLRISTLYNNLKDNNVKLLELNQILARSRSELEENHEKLKKHTESVEADKKTLEKLLMISPQLEGDANTAKKISVPPGKIYLIDEERPVQGFQHFSNIVHQNLPGLCITRNLPSEVRRRYDLKKTPMVWLTQRKSEEEMVLLPDTTKFSSVVTSFLSKTESGVVLVEGLEYLISQTDFDSVLKLIQFLNDKVMGTSNVIMITMDTNILDERQQRHLRKEMNKYDAYASNTILDSLKPQ